VIEGPGFALFAFAHRIGFKDLPSWLGSMDRCLTSFAGSLVPMFPKAPFSPMSVCSFGCVLPIVEALVGGWLLFGLQTGRALISSSVLMLVLTFGSAMRQDGPTVSEQLTYSLIYSLLLAGIRFNPYSVDSRLRRSL
jgi:thiosulfate dehydrogenase (quinone) large subunit